jgi:hypothetical protein
MFPAQFTQHCGVNQWNTNSKVVHATSRTIGGEYQIKGDVWPEWSHEPKVTRAPSGEFVMLFAMDKSKANNATFAAVCKNGTVVRPSPAADEGVNGAVGLRNWMSWAQSPDGPWSKPVSVEEVFTTVEHVHHANCTNLVISIANDGSMTGLWRRCCTALPNQGIEGPSSIIYTVRASHWRNVSTWVANATPTFQLASNGYEDPHIWPDPKRSGVFHAVFHDMIGGWHEPQFNNTQVGSHAFSADGGRSWVDTGVAYNWTVRYTDGSTHDCIRRERPAIITNEDGEPAYLSTSCQYSGDGNNKKTAGQTHTILQPIGRA